jgi:integrase/recombinase XerD
VVSLIVLEDPMKSARNGQSKILSQQEYERLIGAVPTKYATLLRLCSVGGFRISEALSIRTEDLTTTSVLVRKSSTKAKRSTREIPLPPDLVNELQNLEDGGQFLFESKHKPNHPITRQAVDYIFRNACNELGIEGWSLHGTRRFFIHTLHHRNVPLKVIQKAVGHSSLRSTASYIDVEEHHIKDAVSKLWSLV